MSRSAVLVLCALLAGVVCLPVDELDMLQELQELNEPRFPTGAPPAACQDMTPGHDVEPQTSGSPYRLGATKLPDNKVEVTVQALGEDYFEGFMLQPRAVHGDPATIGEFVSEDERVRLFECNEGSGRMDTATHANYTSSGKMQKIALHWHPPEEIQDVFFTLTALREEEEFWVGQVLYWPA